MSIHEHLMLALFDQVVDQAAVVSAFEAGTKTTHDLLMLESEFSDQDLEDQEMAKKMMLGSLAKAMSWRNSRG